MSKHIREASNPGLDTLTASRGWTIDLFAEFWANPSALQEHVPSILAPDIVGYWPGADPVRGAQNYWRYIVELLKLAPDFRARVLEHATNGDVTFVLWEAHGNGPDGPFKCTGCDCIRAHDGIVQENRIHCDNAIFHALARRVAATATSATEPALD